MYMYMYKHATCTVIIIHVLYMYSVLYTYMYTTQSHTHHCLPWSLWSSFKPVPTDLLRPFPTTWDHALLTHPRASTSPTLGGRGDASSPLAKEAEFEREDEGKRLSSTILAEICWRSKVRLSSRGGISKSEGILPLWPRIQRALMSWSSCTSLDELGRRGGGGTRKELRKERGREGGKGGGRREGGEGGREGRREGGKEGGREGGREGREGKEGRKGGERERDRKRK